MIRKVYGVGFNIPLKVPEEVPPALISSCRSLGEAQVAIKFEQDAAEWGSNEICVELRDLAFQHSTSSVGFRDDKRAGVAVCSFEFTKPEWRAEFIEDARELVLPPGVPVNQWEEEG